jgi:hypothetical protein
MNEVIEWISKLYDRFVIACSSGRHSLSAMIRVPSRVTSCHQNPVSTPEFHQRTGARAK